MKSIKITYWISTSLIAVMMTFSAYAYFTQPMVRDGFIKIGFPDYFRIELGIAKLIGALLILLPVAARLKEWVYAGFTITFISAFIAHIASGDTIANAINPLVFLVLLAVSYLTYHKIVSNKNIPVLQ